MDIWVMSATGDDQKRVTEYGGVDNRPSWSPDGRWIAYSSDRDGRSRIWLVAADGSEPERLTEQGSSNPRWAPDGKTVYFHGPPGQNEIWAVTFGDRRERLVADLSGKLGNPGDNALATDGEYLYFAWEDALGDIWVMDVVWDE